MKHFAGLDVSLETTAICILDTDGRVVREISALSHADDIFSALSPYVATLEAIGLEAGPLSEFLVCGLKSKGVQAILMETRRVHAALSAVPGETDRSGSITKAGNASVRCALYQAAHVMMVRTTKWTPLKAWAMWVAARRGAKCAKVALARKLAVIMHRMRVDGTEFNNA